MTVANSVRSAGGKAPAETSCPACRSAQLAFWFNSRSKRDGRTYAIARCAACGSAFVTPRPSRAYLEEFYRHEAYSDQLGSRTAEESLQLLLAEEAAYPNTLIDAARITGRCAALRPGGRFLDIGAGPGFYSKAAR